MQQDEVTEPTALIEYAPGFVFSGTEKRNERGCYFASDYKMAELLSDSENIASGVLSCADCIGQDLGELLFLDLETCGLSGVPVFLIGTMRLVDGNFQIRQFFARDYSEEPAILHHIGDDLSQTSGVVTFNGKSFDIPFLRDRMIVQKVRFLPPRVHHDLIYGARRKWKGTLPDCRLQTLESMICKRRRTGDVPGGEIPRLYHQYVKTGDIAPLLPVFKHNVLDLMTMAELLPKIVG